MSDPRKLEAGNLTNGLTVGEIQKIYQNLYSNQVLIAKV